MCTVTIVREHQRLLVTMNRDDAATREEAPPTHWPNEATAFAAPKDLQAGGTWIGLNRYGVIACLLNRYDIAPVGQKSRGEVAIEAMRGATMQSACSVLADLDHRLYSPFTCLIITREGAARLDWTGSALNHAKLSGADNMMVTSSSWRPEEVRSQREALFREVWSSGESTVEKIAAFHVRRVSTGDAWTPMMLRPASQTKSVTQVELTPHSARMRYWTREAAIASELSPSASSGCTGLEFAWPCALQVGCGGT